MHDEINYKNNPLHGISLKKMLTDLVDHYGFEILYAYLNINSFKTNPSIVSSVKFLKKTDWARERVENFYLYEFKNLPRASFEQFQLSPRDRIIPDEQEAGEPAELSLEDAGRLQQKRAKKAASYGQGPKEHQRSNKRPGAKKDRDAGGSGSGVSRKAKRESPEVPAASPTGGFNPWGKSRKS